MIADDEMVSKSIRDISQGAEVCPIPYDDNFLSGVSLKDSFKYVKTNIPGPGFNTEMFYEQFAGCDCNGDCVLSVCSCLQLFGSAYDGVGKLKVEHLSALLSKPVLECGLACSCDPKSCTNRVVQQGIKKSLNVFQTKHKGYGLMLDKNHPSEVPSLSFICEYAGEVIEDTEARKRMNETEKTNQLNYLIALREHVLGAETCIYIDPHYIGNVGRFINHSCDPNLLMVPVRVNHQVPRLALFTRKNVTPGEELTFDYSGNATINLCSDSTPNNKPFNSQSCFCHSETSDSSGNISSGSIKFDKIVDTSDSSCNISSGSIKFDKIVDTSDSSGNISISNIQMDKIVHISNSSGNISLNGTLMDKVNQTSVCSSASSDCTLVEKILKTSAQFEESNIDHPRKRLKTYQSDCSLSTLIHTTENHCFTWNNDGQDKTENEVTLQQSADEVVNCEDTPLSETADTKVGFAAFVKRKPCFCSSLNCTGFLPFDSGLLCD